MGEKDVDRESLIATDVVPGRAEELTATNPDSLAGVSLFHAGIHSGERIGDYEIIRELGRGGMGQVFLARDTRLGRKVAIKFLLPDKTTNLARFLTEARVTAQITHENIVVIHAVDEFQGRPYMVLEYLEGESLRALSDRESMSPERAIEIMIQVVRALVRAHASKVVHRDLKPDNVFLTRSGTVKVLDFGIAKFLQRFEHDTESDVFAEGTAPAEATVAGTVMGTLPYMSPEQLNRGQVDHQSDIWAIGIMFWRMLTGQHPAGFIAWHVLAQFASDLDRPTPSLASASAAIPHSLVRIVDRCLAKRKEHRYASAEELLHDLERATQGGSKSRSQAPDNPFPGMAPFQEQDADRFFGRSADIARVLGKFRLVPLVVVVGPSGVGKSSLVRAGVIPALHVSGERWQTLTLRPGRHPLQSLASALHSALTTQRSSAKKAQAYDALLARLESEPGYLGSLLREYARDSGGKVLLFIDQFEEMYTQASRAERDAMTAAIIGAADDPSAPVRVILSLRSDFLDRADENPAFMEEVNSGLVLLPLPNQQNLREAIIAPVESAGYRFEDASVIEDMLRALENSKGALPLLQYAAARLWEQRDRRQRILPSAGYFAMGGVGGALASHADQVLDGMTAQDRQHARNIFMRLVTQDQTRRTLDVSELDGLSARPEEIHTVVQQLIQARLLTTQTMEDGGNAIEIVHESLIVSWPRLRRWLGENQEDTALLNEVSVAAGQWRKNNFSGGLLWRGELAAAAIRFLGRHQGALADHEKAFLVAIKTQALRVTRRRRSLVILTIACLCLVAVGTSIGLVRVATAEKTARNQARVAEKEALRAKQAEQEVNAKLEELRRAEAARTSAESAKQRAETQVKQSEVELAVANEKLTDALNQAQAEKERAQAASKQANNAKAEFERLYEREKKRREELEKRRGKMATEL